MYAKNSENDLDYIHLITLHEVASFRYRILMTTTTYGSIIRPRILLKHKLVVEMHQTIPISVVLLSFITKFLWPPSGIRSASSHISHYKHRYIYLLSLNLIGGICFKSELQDSTRRNIVTYIHIWQVIKLV